jgi:hypothetical protein
MAGPQRAFNDETGQYGYVHTINGQPRFIADSDNPAEDVGPFGAALIGAGQMVSTTPERVQAVFGDEEALASVEQTEALMRPLREDHGFATGIGESVPGMLVPGAKLAQTAVGAAEGALLDVNNPERGAAISGALSFLGGELGERAAGAIIGRLNKGAVGELARQGVPTTAAQRSGSVTQRNIEAGLEAIPVLSNWLRRPVAAQQAALNRGAGQVFGYEGALTPKGLGEAKGIVSRQFDEVEQAIPDMALPQHIADQVENLNILDATERKLVDLTGNLDGEGWLRVRSTLNEQMADLAMEGATDASRQVRMTLNQVDDIIEAGIDNPATMELWQQSRQQWKFLTALGRGQSVSGAGDVNLRSMVSSLRTIYPNFRFGRELPGAAQDFGNLVTALDELPKALQSSGSAERGTAAAILLGGAGTVEPNSLILPAVLAASQVAQPGGRLAAPARAAERAITQDTDPNEPNE